MAGALKANYDRDMQTMIAAECSSCPPILLHSCCGPCSSAVLERLCPHFEVTVYYDNPNIYPEAEFLRRAAEQRRLLSEMAPAGKHVDMLLAPWDEAEFYEAVRGHETDMEGGERCEICFSFRLTRCAMAAKRLGFPYFTSTLTVSPHKNAEKVNAAGFAAERLSGVRYLPSDFKKRNGYLRSLQLSAEYHLYRQDYCGCVFSMRQKNEGQEGQTQS